ncbi:uncharacterized protein [Parasteatoda tepidariorum]|uniref:uncharacterized protein isoform X1 n=1 Tax=Parasteatoda tepidariorum TaxID=114398 RepID=UPI00077FDBB1|nr:uncharacterized protein LOC107438132 isoform X1 [Parasteatoda tepidariorum]
MKRGFLRTIIFILWNISNVFGYRIFYMKESGSCSGNLVEINIGSFSRNSSGILMSGKSSIYEPALNCSIYLRAPLSYGVVISIRNIDLQPMTDDCENYVEISPVEHHGLVKLCGYSHDQFEFQSYISRKDTRISFHTSNYTSQKKASFQLTFTAVRNGFCFKDEKRCRNHNCIWKGLACDGHNNCGDLSDEFDKHISQCSTMSPGESLAVILVTIIGSLILLFIAAYLRGPKITQQIERLSQTNQNNDNLDVPVARSLGSSRTPGPSLRTPIPGPPLRTPIPGPSWRISTPGPSSRTTIPALNRISTNYGSISQFFTSCDFDDVIYPDPPPRYEESVRPSSSSQFPVISSQIFPQVSADSRNGNHVEQS